MKYLILLLITATYSNVFSQNTYIKTDTTVTTGVILLDGTESNNTKYIIEVKDGNSIKHLPSDITEYCLKNGDKFIAKSISINDTTGNRFVEYLEEDSIKLYYIMLEGKKHFYVENDTLFSELLKRGKNYKDTLAFYTQKKAWVKKQAQYVRFNKQSIDRFISLYNQDKKRQLTHNRIGIISGYYNNSIYFIKSLKSKNIEELTFKNSQSSSIGIFYELFIASSPISLYSEVNYTKNHFIGEYKFATRSQEAVIKYNQINVPLLLRYTTPGMRWHLFGETGINVRHLFDTYYELHQTTFLPHENIYENIPINDLLIENMVEYTIGTGVQYNIDHRRRLSAEIRYSVYKGDPNYLGANQLALLIGLSF